MDDYLTPEEVARKSIDAFNRHDQAAFPRTSQRLEVEWGPTSKLIMGGAADLVVGALLRVVGKYDQNNPVHGEQDSQQKHTKSEPGRGNRPKNLSHSLQGVASYGYPINRCLDLETDRGRLKIA